MLVGGGMRGVGVGVDERCCGGGGMRGGGVRGVGGDEKWGG